MSRMEQMNISITPKLAEYVRRRVSEGGYSGASEVVREALRLMEKYQDAEIRQNVSEAYAAIDQSRFTDYSVDQLDTLAIRIKKSGRARHEAHQKPVAAK